MVCKEIFSLHLSIVQKPRYSLKTSHSSSYFAVVEGDDRLFIYDNKGIIQDTFLSSNKIYGYDWCRQKDELAIIFNTNDDKICLWNLEKSFYICEIGIKEENMTFISWCNNKKLLALGSTNGNLVIYNLSNKKRIQVMGKHNKSAILCGTWSPPPSPTQSKSKKKGACLDLLVLGGADSMVTISNQSGEPAFESQSKCVIPTRNPPTEILFDPQGFAFAPDKGIRLSVVIVMNHNNSSSIMVIERCGDGATSGDSDRECNFDAQYGTIKRCFILPTCTNNRDEDDLGFKGETKMTLIILFNQGSLIQLTLYQDKSSKNTFDILPIRQEVNDIAIKELSHDKVLVFVLYKKNKVKTVTCAPQSLVQYLRDNSETSAKTMSVAEEFRINYDPKEYDKLLPPAVADEKQSKIKKMKKPIFDQITISADYSIVYLSSNQGHIKAYYRSSPEQSLVHAFDGLYSVIYQEYPDYVHLFDLQRLEKSYQRLQLPYNVGHLKALAMDQNIMAGVSSIESRLLYLPQDTMLKLVGEYPSAKVVKSMSLSTGHLITLFPDGTLEILKISLYTQNGEKDSMQKGGGYGEELKIIHEGVICYATANGFLFYSDSKGTVLCQDLAIRCKNEDTKDESYGGPVILLQCSDTIKCLSVHSSGLFILVITDLISNCFLWNVRTETKHLLTNADGFLSHDFVNLSADNVFVLWESSGAYPYPIFCLNGIHYYVYFDVIHKGNQLKKIATIAKESNDTSFIVALRYGHLVTFSPNSSTKSKNELDKFFTFLPVKELNIFEKRQLYSKDLSFHQDLFQRALSLGHFDIAWTTLKMLPRDEMCKHLDWAQQLICVALKLLRIDWAMYVSKDVGEILTMDKLSKMAELEDIDIMGKTLDTLYMVAPITLTKENNKSLKSDLTDRPKIFKLLYKEIRERENEQTTSINLFDLIRQAVSYKSNRSSNSDSITQAINNYIQAGKISYFKCEEDLNKDERFGDSVRSELNDIISYHYVEKVFKLIDEHNVDLQSLELLDLDSQHLPNFYLRLAEYFDRKNSFLNAGKYYDKAENYDLALKCYLNAANQFQNNQQPVNDKYENAVNGAISVVKRFQSDAQALEIALQKVAGFLLRENNTDNDLKKLLRLYINCQRYNEVNRIALIIIDVDKRAGFFADAHQIAYETFGVLRKSNGRKDYQDKHDEIISDDLDLQLMLLHSYKIIKLLMKAKLHYFAAKLLLRLVFEYKNEFFVGSVCEKYHESAMVLAALECSKAGLHSSAYKCAALILQQNLKVQSTGPLPSSEDSLSSSLSSSNNAITYADINAAHLTKLQNIVRKRGQMKDGVVDKQLSCKFCEQSFEESLISCPKCGERNYPYCILTGFRLPANPPSKSSFDEYGIDSLIGICKNCHFLYNQRILKEYKKIGIDKCPMCEASTLSFDRYGVS